MVLQQARRGWPGQARTSPAMTPQNWSNIIEHAPYQASAKSMNGALNGAPARLVFDFTTTALWSGPPAGIVRVESEFARWALAHVDELALGFFDPKTRAFRGLDRNIAAILISQKAAIDPFSFVNPARLARRKTDRIPAAVRPAAMWLLQF